MGLAAVGVGLALLVLEGALRVKAWMDDADRLEAAVAREEPPPARGQHVTLRQLVRVSSNPRIIYELRPELDVVFLGERVVTSPDGIRAPAPAPDKPAGTVRVVGIGDSVMFGWGVPYERSYLPALRDRLRAEAPDRRWDVVNLAVPGYNTAMEVETLRVKGLRWAPDVVIVGYVWNDLELPYFLRDRADYLSLSESFLGTLLSRAVTTLRAATPGRSALDTAPPPDALVEGLHARVPAIYRSLVGADAFARAMNELAALGRARGFAVVVHTDNRLPEALAAICRAHGFTVVEQGPVLEAYMARHGIAELRGSVLTLSTADPHPSALAHGLIAETLLGAVRAAAARGTGVTDPRSRSGAPVPLGRAR
jgi:lysophospholipase L1-like esterase